MPVKFGRNYKLFVQKENGDQLIVEPPFSMQFDVTRNILTSANICQIRLYNLGQKARDFLRFDYSNYSERVSIALRAGYGTNLPSIFTGNINQGWSVREETNFITTVECFDGGYAFVNGFVPANLGFPKNTEWETIYRTLISYLVGVSVGAIGPKFTIGDDGSPLTITRYYAPDPNKPIVDILQELTGRAFFIDNGRAYILSNSEVLSSLLGVQVVNSGSGLLSTPLRERNMVNLDLLFEPGVVIGQKLRLDSLTAQHLSSAGIADAHTTNVNGLYKVVSIKHRGMISESVCGDATTTLGLYFGSEALIEVANQQ